MSTIRPAGLAPTPPTSPAQRPDAARLEAQRAFFQMASGQVAAPARPAPAAAALQTAPAAPAPPRPQRIPSADAEPPARILRPGSLLDIRV